MKNGLFITFEGGEGCGKTTQLRLLAKNLKRKKIPIVITKEPGGTETGKRIRHILLDPKTGKLSPRSELLLYEADRAHHVDSVIIPALNKGNVVLCDRFSDSSTVYQGLSRKLGRKPVEWLNEFATGKLVPDLVILLDLNEAVGFERVNLRLKNKTSPDRMEQENREFHKRVRQGFLKLAKENINRFKIVDASRPESEIAMEIAALIKPYLIRRGICKRKP